MLKPRSQAAALGIKKLQSAEELWRALEIAGDGQADYLIEQFVPGDVYHVDSIVYDSKVRFAVASRYETPPFQVAHEGGIFVTRTLPAGDSRVQSLLEINARVLESFRLLRGVSHTEFIRAGSGDVYFLETSARVGGAYIVDVVEAATGINLWREWARVEIAGEQGPYEPPASQTNAAVSCCRWPVRRCLTRAPTPIRRSWVRIKKPHHAGLIVASKSSDRVAHLLADYTRRFHADFHTSAPAPERPTE